MKTSLVAIIAVAIIAVVGLSFVFLGGQPGNAASSTTTSTTTPTTSPTQLSPPPGVRTAFDTHLSRIGSRDIPTVLTDYQDSAVVTWAGNAAGLQGNYSGTSNIRLLYSAALSTATQISATPSNYVQVNKSSNQVVVNSTLILAGKSNYLGAFNGTVQASISYVYSNGGWLISHEYWNYKKLTGSSSGGATTFPEWQKVGPINPSRRSTDWLHNFAWDYGGPGVAVLVWAFVGLIAAVAVVRGVWKPSK
jgi:hypothetical protein